MRIFHHIWLGDRPLPDYAVANLEAMKRLYPWPEYKHWLWTDESVPVWGGASALFNSVRGNLIQAADVLRYELLYAYGGIYLDTDMEPVNPLPEIAWQVDLLGCRQSPNVYGTAILGSRPKHPFWLSLLKAIPASIADPANHPCVCWQTGPTFITRQLAVSNDFVTCLPQASCYPYCWDEKPIESPESYFIHRWKNGDFEEAS